MELIHRQQCDGACPRPIYLICVFRDESLLLEYFMDYYRSLGVTHFIMIDNQSEDEGPEFLKSLKDINLYLFRTDASYKEAAYGTRWVNQMLEQYCMGQYCFTVDVDELFLLNTRKYPNLQDLVADMESSGSNAVPATLLDMYPESINNDYQRGSDFLSHSPFFDELNDTYYEVWHELYDTFLFRVGGVRKRVLGVTACMQKFPLIKYDFSPLGVAPGYHVFQQNGEVVFQSHMIRLHRNPSVLMHFKFIKPQFPLFVEQRIMRNEDWEDSAEYQAYKTVLDRERGELRLFDQRFSKRYENIDSLEKFLGNGDAGAWRSRPIQE